ncbi:metallophosphoesterase family protein [Psychrobacter sp. I-STPA10]|uniref:metallophosphoesterase family protein n=1 Tax=Psychrobacter sp. I-STPA10 TaxID=2585769 RepID=UPI001E2CBD10|nr:metallophosphoesterase [Psychrobacter sp. I-STPA10]
MLRVAIFADIHGKFLLPFKLVAHYQKTTGKSIDLILQCGDMGAFPDKSRMDKATLRHAQNDRDELGFIDGFAYVHTEIAQFLDELNVDMLCVRGNHEDHEFLDKLEEDASFLKQPAYPIDAYNRVWVCRTAIPIVIQSKANTPKESKNFAGLKPQHKKDTHNTKQHTDNDSLTMVGVGRIGDRKGRTHPQYIQDYERQALKKLAKNAQEFDVLVTHDKSSDSHRGYGSAEIKELLNHVAFAYHFYGHTGEPFSQTLDDNGITQSVKVRELEFNSHGKLEAGCMLILEKSADKLMLTPVPLNDMIGFMKNTWHYL